MNLNEFNAQLEDPELTELQRKDFSGKSLKNLPLINMILKDFNFTAADMTGTNLSHSNCKGCNFTDTIMLVHGICETNFQDAIFSNTKMWNGAIENYEPSAHFGGMGAHEYWVSIFYHNVVFACAPVSFEEVETYTDEQCKELENTPIQEWIDGVPIWWNREKSEVLEKMLQHRNEIDGL